MRKNEDNLTDEERMERFRNNLDREIGIWEATGQILVAAAMLAAMILASAAFD